MLSSVPASPRNSPIDAASHEIIKRLPQASPSCPNIAVSPENDEVWITLKDAGNVQVYSAKPPFEQKALLDMGPITNHMNFVNNRNGKFAYVTIGGLSEVKVFRRGSTPQLFATIPVGDLPQGIWPSGDGSRVYVALENSVQAAVIECRRRERNFFSGPDLRQKPPQKVCFSVPVNC
jgi:DNA-binding beta-propeller fold protein YncE